MDILRKSDLWCAGCGNCWYPGKEDGKNVQEKLIGCSVSRKWWEGQKEYFSFSPQTKSRSDWPHWLPLNIETSSSLQGRDGPGQTEWGYGKGDFHQALLQFSCGLLHQAAALLPGMYLALISSVLSPSSENLPMNWQACGYSELCTCVPSVIPNCHDTAFCRLFSDPVPVEDFIPPSWTTSIIVVLCFYYMARRNKILSVRCKVQLFSDFKKVQIRL